MTDWEKFLERRKANIGFITRGKAFRDPTPGEMEVALRQEINSWQESIGKKPFHLGAEYSTPKGHGVNLLRDREPEEPIKMPRRLKAIQAYVETPMDEKGILATQGIDVDSFKWKEIGIIKAFISWMIGKTIRRKK